MTWKNVALPIALSDTEIVVLHWIVQEKYEENNFLVFL